MASPFNDNGTLWVVHIGNNDRIGLRALKEGFVCLGWTAMGDLAPHSTREAMRKAMEAAFPSAKPRTISASYGQVFRFAHEMQIGDALVYPVRATSEIAIGRISGPYRFALDDTDLASNDYHNVRPVEWLKVVSRTAFSQAALHSFGSFSSVSTSDDHMEEVLAVLTGTSAEEPASSVSHDDPEAEEEQINLYEVARQETEDYLLKAWQRTGTAFEEVVAAVFEALGYTATVTPKSGDHGVDVIAHPDPLGLERPFIKVQAKSGTSSIGEPEVNQLKGLLNPGEQGVVVSLGKFTPGALAVARASANLKLIGPRQFVALFLDHYESLDPSWRARFPLKRVFVPVA
ncbi:MAG TPA: restriction endonuclease [Rubricoccaceae bacterium]|nr:restriction endonuclease [Rubricoccaceae bacterium]